MYSFSNININFDALYFHGKLDLITDSLFLELRDFKIKMETNPEIIEVAKILNRMEEATFQCPICMDRMVHPVRLRCEHTFCRMCIERHIRTSHNYEDNSNNKRYHSYTYYVSTCIAQYLV